MEIARRQARIDQLVREMLVQGHLNDHFLLIQTTQAAGDLKIVAKIIIFYCMQIREYIRAIANHLTKPDVDYAGAALCAGHLGIHSSREIVDNIIRSSNAFPHLSSDSIGAQSILYACRSFMHACANGSKPQCVGVFSMLHYDYSCLLPKFQEILQLEIEILQLRQQR